MADPSFQLLSAVRYDIMRPWKESTDAALSSEKQSQLSDADREAQSSPIFLVSYHRDRLAQAADAFGWSEAAARIRSNDTLRRFHTLAVEAIAKERAAGAVDVDLNAPWKIRPVVYRDGTLQVTALPVPSRPFDILAASALTPETAPEWLNALPAPYNTPLEVYLDLEPTPRSLFTSHKTTQRDAYNDARERLKIEALPVAAEVVLHNEDGEVTEGALRNVSFWRDGTWVTPPLKSGGIGGTVRRWMIEQGRVKEGIVKVQDLKDGDWVLLSNGVEGCSIGKFRATKQT